MQHQKIATINHWNYPKEIWFMTTRQECYLDGHINYLKSQRYSRRINKLEEAKQKCIKAMKALPGENSEEDINQYLRLWDSINFYIGYERKFKETLKH